MLSCLHQWFILSMLNGETHLGVTGKIHWTFILPLIRMGTELGGGVIWGSFYKPMQEEIIWAEPEIIFQSWKAGIILIVGRLQRAIDKRKLEKWLCWTILSSGKTLSFDNQFLKSQQQKLGRDKTTYSR